MHAANLHGVVVYTEGELTSQKICSRYVSHFVGLT